MSQVRQALNTIRGSLSGNAPRTTHSSSAVLPAPVVFNGPSGSRPVSSPSNPDSEQYSNTMFASHSRLIFDGPAGSRPRGSA
ncbi:hypothetical protein PUNSTDRAFT_118009 [Punctularia strigosozonata HHB-11173 SS5]|uniref:uncharacterized protein n=1 Tax=Punctularia strigosozonata (strain HHB-11173) TaxID=741275 RepID=UPI00044171D8|nr:uncharacterized protein PUNSTDRAFT_118009 [Punctularia strigosozonata HHB-11173 SS5]EIN14541.1 hypothetical protein PUNSTDRAFT_118009 [Punctularia strigosozonata HHB-11173 SS5]